MWEGKHPGNQYKSARDAGKSEEGQLPWKQEKGATQSMVCHSVLFQSKESVEFRLHELGIAVSAGWPEARASSGVCARP